MSAVSNLRARNYHIEEADNFKIKLIAGKIIPAISTTTATIVGAVGIEMIKYLLKKKAEIYKNVTINLALPLLIFNETTPALVSKDCANDVLMGGPVKVVPGNFTKWDKINIKGPISVNDLKKQFEDKYNIKISMITHGAASIYPVYGTGSKDRLSLPIEEVIKIVTKKEVPKYKKFLPISISAYD